MKKDAPVGIVYQRCCGMDIHKDSIVACSIDEHGKSEIRTYGAMTNDLLEMCAWLQKEKVQMVAMESTASYWKPIFNLLEIEEIPAMLVNAQHVKNVPGERQTFKMPSGLRDCYVTDCFGQAWFPSVISGN